MREFQYPTIYIGCFGRIYEDNEPGQTFNGAERIINKDVAQRRKLGLRPGETFSFGRFCLPAIGDEFYFRGAS
jgi:hypothetical protein